MFVRAAAETVSIEDFTIGSSHAFRTRCTGAGGKADEVLRHQAVIIIIIIIIIIYLFLSPTGTKLVGLTINWSHSVDAEWHGWNGSYSMGDEKCPQMMLHCRAVSPRKFSEEDM